MDQVRQLVISESHWKVMAQHVEACLPEEACGLIGGWFSGTNAFAEEILPVENDLHRPDRYRMEPQAQVEAFLVLEKHGLDLVGIFHSHPAGPDLPSNTDVAEFQYPGVLSIIFSPNYRLPGWKSRAFILQGNHFLEVSIHYASEHNRPHHRTSL